MAFPQWPKSTAEQERKSNLSEELFRLVGSEDRDIIISAVERLRALLQDLPRTSRSLSKSDRELVIPLESSEQKEAILDALYDLSIFPWEDNGQLIIEHKKDVEKLRAAGFEDRGLPVVSQPATDTRLSGTRSKDETFPMQYPQSLSEEMRTRYETGKTILAAKQMNHLPLGAESEVEPGADTELNELINRFDSGLVEEDDPEFRKTLGYIPSLRLFPQKYVWQNGTVIEKRSGKEIPAEDMGRLYLEAKEGNEGSITKLVRMHTGLVLKVVSKYVDKFGGDPDDLFQEGMIGLLTAIEDYDPTVGAFSTFAIIKIEQKVRREGSENRKPIRLPAHIKKHASELRRAKEAVSVEGELRPEDVFAEMPDHRPSLGPRNESRIPTSGIGLDRLERLYYLNAAFDPVSTDEDNAIDEQLAPHRVVEENSADPSVYLTQEQLAREVGKVLLSLTPREEQVLRLRFGLSEPSGISKERIISEQGRLSSQGLHSGERTLDEVAILFGITKERIRQIEAKALRKLKRPPRSKALGWFLENPDDTFIKRNIPYGF